jgi:hypothetical protein
MLAFSPRKELWEVCFPIVTPLKADSSKGFSETNGY